MQTCAPTLRPHARNASLSDAGRSALHTFSHTALFTALFLAAIPVATAADDGSKKEDAAPALSPDPAFLNGPEAQVRIDLLDISMPEEKFVTLLPELLDKVKIEKAVPGLLEAVKRKEVTLEGCATIVTKSGDRAVSETNAQPNFIQPPIILVPDIQPPYTPVPVSTTPVSFYGAPPIGVYFEVEPVIAADGRHIDLNVEPMHVELLGYHRYLLPKKQTIPFWGIDGPDEAFYAAMKTTTSVTLLSGQHLLLAVHKKDKPEGTIEIAILHAESLPGGK